MIPSDIKEVFWNFYVKMIKEYNRHYPEKGDSWRILNLEEFLSFFTESLQSNSVDTIKENPEHLIDIALECMMIYTRLTGDDEDG